MKVVREAIRPDADQSFRLLLTPNLNHLFYWHFHPEFEIVYAEAESGRRHIGHHLSRYTGSDLVLIGPNIPHLNFDYGIRTACEQVVVQMQQDFLGKEFWGLPEMQSIQALFEKGKGGIAFHSATKEAASQLLKRMQELPPFQQLLQLLQVLHLLAQSDEYELLHCRPLAQASVWRGQQRMQQVYSFVELNFFRKIEVAEVAGLCNLSVPAFCRYFKKTTRLTFTEFLQHYRVEQARQLLLHDKNVTEACYESGFENLSHFNKTFKKIAGVNPSTFRKENHTPVRGS